MADMPDLMSVFNGCDDYSWCQLDYICNLLKPKYRVYIHEGFLLHLKEEDPFLIQIFKAHLSSRPFELGKPISNLGHIFCWKPR